jgi:folate-dependent phosphoribosylglycinamide formyltransferase PurN
MGEGGAISGRPIRVVMFGSGPSLTHEARRFLARLEKHPEIELLGAFCQADTGSRLAFVKDLWRRRGVLALPLLVAWYGNIVASYLRQPGAELELRRTLGRLAERMHFVQDIHGAEVLEQVAGLAPDLGLVYGSPILKPALFEIPAHGTLGIHHGKVPQYRGNKTTFWAVYNGDRAAGVTIQKINPGLDTGEIVKEGEVPVGRSSLRRISSELETLGLDLYIQAILEVKAGTATFRPQSGPKGKLYRNPKPADFLRFAAKRLARRVSRAGGD